MGCVGVTEGAIPFAAADPLRVIPANMIGAAALASPRALMGAQCYAGWGGLIVRCRWSRASSGLLPRCWSAPASALPAIIPAESLARIRKTH